MRGLLVAIRSGLGAVVALLVSTERGGGRAVVK
jgi:hypothetical protein